MPSKLTDYRRGDPTRTPDWRCRAAQTHLERGSRPRRWEDEGIIELVKFALALEGAAAPAQRLTVQRRSPALALAHEIYHRGGVVRDEIEARLLAGESADAIGEKTGIAAVAISAFEHYFFEVIECLHAHDLIMFQAVGIGPWRGVMPTEAQAWKWIAVAVGPWPLDLMIADYLGRLEPVVSDRAWIAKKLRFAAKDHALGYSAEAIKTLMPEWCELFAEEIRAAKSRPDGATLGLHIDFLRMVAGMGSTDGKASHSRAKAPQESDVVKLVEEFLNA